MAIFNRYVKLQEGTSNETQFQRDNDDEPMEWNKMGVISCWIAFVYWIYIISVEIQWLRGKTSEHGNSSTKFWSWDLSIHFSGIQLGYDKQHPTIHYIQRKK